MLSGPHNEEVKQEAGHVGGAFLKLNCDILSDDLRFKLKTVHCFS